MSTALSAFPLDSSQHVQAVPPGRYPAVIIDSELKDIRAGTGKYLQLAFEVSGGPYAGHVAFARYCIQHINPVTARIAKKDLAAVCEAAGVPQPKDSAELHDRPLSIEINCERKPDGRIVNVITGVFKADMNHGPH